MPIGNSHETPINWPPSVEPELRIPAAVPRRLGFLAGKVATPGDFDQLADAEIATLFGGT